MRYGEKSDDRWSKFDYAATAAASLAHLLQGQQDAVGLLTFDTKIRNHLPPSTHPSHLKQMLHELEQTEPANKTDVSDAFLQLAGQISTRGLVMLFSDLFVNRADLGKALQQFRIRKQEVIVFHVMHNDELTFPFQENTLFRGLEVDAQLHTEPRALRRSYLEVVERFTEDVKKECASLGIDYVLMNTKEPLDAVLTTYLTFRQRTRRKLLRQR